MKPELRDFFLARLNGHRLMSIATNRSDGRPQATTVAYINDGLTLYCFIARIGQCEIGSFHSGLRSASACVVGY